MEKLEELAQREAELETLTRELLSRSVELDSRENLFQSLKSQVAESLEAEKVAWEKLRQRDVNIQQRELAVTKDEERLAKHEGALKEGLTKLKADEKELQVKLENSEARFKDVRDQEANLKKVWDEFLGREAQLIRGNKALESKQTKLSESKARLKEREDALKAWSDEVDQEALSVENRAKAIMQHA